MDSILFKEWMKDLNKKFQAKERIIDSCPDHPIIDNLSNIKLVFYHQIPYL